MNKIFFFIGLLVSAAYHAAAQPTLTRFEDIDSLQREKARPLVIYIYTDWCKYCNMMSKGTLNKGRVEQTLNENFMFVKLNAESEEDITLKGKTFSFRSNGMNRFFRNPGGQVHNLLSDEAHG
jgi:thioredoxin-related protein